MIKYVYTLTCCLLFLQVSCSTGEKKNVAATAPLAQRPSLKSVNLPPSTAPSFQIGPVVGANEPPVELKLVSEKNRVEISSNCHVAVFKTYLKNELRNKRVESVDFKVKTTTMESKKDVEQYVETFYKDGPSDLHDLAFPELGEKIPFIFTASGKVLKAGGYAPNSMFFVPPIPLPTKAVKVGDQWENVSTFVGEASQVPLTSKMTSKFVSWRPCGKSRCAEISVHGSIHMPEKIEKTSGFDHRITGLFLLEPKRGLVPWSEFVADEQMQDPEARVVVRSTLRSVLLQPPGYHIVSRAEQACPSEKMEE